MTTLPKETTVETSNLQPGELIHMDFVFYNVTPIRGLTSILTVIYENTRMILVLCTASKQYPIKIDSILPPYVSCMM